MVGVALYGTIFGYGVALLAQEDGWKFVQQNSHIAQSDSTSANIHPISSFYKFHFPSEASHSFFSTGRSCFFIIFFLDPVFHKLRVIFMC